MAGFLYMFFILATSGSPDIPLSPSIPLCISPPVIIQQMVLMLSPSSFFLVLVQPAFPVGLCQLSPLYHPPLRDQAQHLVTATLGDHQELRTSFLYFTSGCSQNVIYT